MPQMARFITFSPEHRKFTSHFVFNVQIFIIELKQQHLPQISNKYYYLVLLNRYDEGRISQTGNAQSTCAVSIKRGLQADNGTWTCEIAVLDRNHKVQSLKANIDVVVTGT